MLSGQNCKRLCLGSSSCGILAVCMVASGWAWSYMVMVIAMVFFVALGWRDAGA